MSDTPFYTTRMGKTYYESTMPRLVAALERIAEAAAKTPPTPPGRLDQQLEGATYPSGEPFVPSRPSPQAREIAEQLLKMHGMPYDNAGADDYNADFERLALRLARAVVAWPGGK